MTRMQTLAKPVTSFTAAPSGILQRKCACGAKTSGDAKCSKCKGAEERKLPLQLKAFRSDAITEVPQIVTELRCSPGHPLDSTGRGFPEPRFGHDFSSVQVNADAVTLGVGYSQTHIPVMQRKRTVGASDDPLEQEADRVADRVLAAPSLPTVSGAPQKIQRFTVRPTDEAETSPTSVDRVLASPGTPLEPALQADMSQRFGYDFSRVRVHTGTVAEQSSRDLSARAYTVGHDIVFGAGQFSPGTHEGRRLMAHELAHVVQQGAAVPYTMGSEGRRPSTAFHGTREQAGSPVSGVIQRAGDPTKIPPGFDCPTDLTPGRPAGTDVPFPVLDATITPTQTALLTAFRTTWLAAGGTDDILVHGYASTDGDQGPNWTLSCERAKAVREELVRLGIPRVRINVNAHGESTDFGATPSPNRHAVVSTSASVLPLPLVLGVLTAVDNFAGRSTTRFGVGEVINLSFGSLPPRPAADFGGLEWRLVSGGGTLVPGLAANDGTATYTAPATAGAVQLELRVATGAIAGRVISTHAITIVIPSGVRMTAVAGTAPSFSLAGPIPAGTWGAGFQANVFVDPRDVSFQGVVFGEGTVASVVTGSFQGSFVHPVNTFGPGHAGNAVTGTPVSPPVDNIVSERKGPAGTAPLIGPFCGASDFLWAIPWEFSVAGGARTPFAGGFTANHHVTSTFSCEARIDKGGAGPFCRRINGTTC
jgi:outer membrane protein OmpA-like peptidoglycan-associated protein